MAECQVQFDYTDDVVQKLVGQLSDKRYSTYLKGAGHDDEFAFQLYLYNARLAKSFLFPLHVVEVVLRNGIDEVLSHRFGAQWHQSDAFLGILTAESSASLRKAILRASRDGKVLKDDVVSHLTFDFWSNLFRPEYDRPLWQAGMRLLLPGAPTTTRAEFQPRVARINRFRNRIAHHEPILSEDATLRLREIIDAVASRSKVTADWLKGHATVHQVIRSRPKAAVAASSR